MANQGILSLLQIESDRRNSPGEDTIVGSVLGSADILTDRHTNIGHCQLHVLYLLSLHRLRNRPGLAARHHPGLDIWANSMACVS